MNKKRFILAEDSNGLFSIFDNEDKENEPLIYGAEFGTDKIVDLLNEQQATIKKLQDLCGESDGENAKLRIENKELQEEIKLLKPVNIEQYEQIVQLQEENEQLKNRLNKDL